jgi:TRAP-type C4-dicarboxylate transport system substrate-binding protein
MFVRSVMAAAVAAFVAGQASAADKIEWNASLWGNPRAVTKGIEAVAAYVEEKSGGNFTIKINYGETLSSSRENIDGISLGAFEVAQMCTSYHPGKNPLGTVLDLPFLPLPTFGILVKVHDAFQNYAPWQKELSRWNAKTWVTAVLPQYEFMGVGEPPRTLEAWKGMRVRALGGIGDAMRKLGAVPTTVPAPEVYTSLERGVVQAASFPYSYTFGAYRLHEIGKWFTEGLQPGTLHCPFVLGQGAYDRLPAEYKKLMQDAVAINYKALGDAYDETDKKWIPIYKQTMEVITYTEEQHKAFEKVGAEPVWKDWVESNKGKFDSQAVLDFVLKTAKDAAKK